MEEIIATITTTHQSTITDIHDVWKEKLKSRAGIDCVFRGKWNYETKSATNLIGKLDNENNQQTTDRNRKNGKS